MSKKREIKRLCKFYKMDLENLLELDNRICLFDVKNKKLIEKMIERGRAK